MWIHPCGFTHSSSVSVPFRVTGWSMSNSAENEWCADTPAPAPASSTPSAATPTDSILMPDLLPSRTNPCV